MFAFYFHKQVFLTEMFVLKNIPVSSGIIEQYKGKLRIRKRRFLEQIQ